MAVQTTKSSFVMLYCCYFSTLLTFICLTIEDLAPEILRAYRIADNQLTRSSEFDFSKLQTEFKFLYDFKIFGTDVGFTSLQVDKIYNYKIEEPKTSKKSSPKEESCDWIADKIPQKVNKGDLWRLGDNFLYCGNSLEETSYKILMQGELANIVVTDPPYNVKISGHVCGIGEPNTRNLIWHQEK